MMDTARPVAPERTAELRAFTRFYTSVLGVLDEGLLHTPYSLTEGRTVFELAQQDATDLADLRRRLGVDAGYMTRIVTRLEADGLLTRERSTVDGRRQVLRLTDQGRAVFATLDARAAEQAWYASMEGLVAGSAVDFVTDHEPEREAAGIAEVEGEPVGCVFCVAR